MQVATQRPKALKLLTKMTGDHAWNYSDDTYIHNLTHLKAMQKQGKITHIGLTNTDAAHLKMLIDSGLTIATSQVPCSVIDCRITRGHLNDFCVKNDIGLVCYGMLLGGFLGEKWVGQPEPADINELNWSLRNTCASSGPPMKDGDLLYTPN